MSQWKSYVELLPVDLYCPPLQNEMRRQSNAVIEEPAARSWIPNSHRHSSHSPNGENRAALEERTRLLPKTSDQPRQTNDHGEGESYDIYDEDAPPRTLWLHEFWILFRGSIPVILAYTLQSSLQAVSILIVGRASPEDLATAAFSYMFATCTAWLIALGGTTALDTLASSSYTGSSNKHNLGILLQRGFIMLGLFYIPVAFLWAFSEPVFKLLGQDPRLSRDSNRFLLCLIPGGLGYIYFEAMKKYLQAQGIS